MAFSTRRVGNQSWTKSDIPLRTGETKHGNEISGSVKCGELLDLPRESLDSPEVLYYWQFTEIGCDGVDWLRLVQHNVRRNEIQLAIQCGQFFASQEGLCSMQLVTTVGFLTSYIFSTIISVTIFYVLLLSYL
jgi:hypothetical protein